jgi:NADPH:quinone reductase-like Zn-dependent oxidoreductase
VGHCPVPFVPQKLVSFVVKEHADELRAVNLLVAVGKVAPVQGLTFPLEKGADAVAAFEAGDSRGRIVVTP